MANIVVDPCSVGPISLNRDNGESMPFDHTPRNGSAGYIEFPATVRSLAKHQDLRIRKTVKVRGKIRCVLGPW
ncbi:MAG: hypothetical protein O9293_12660 [Porphyrobacter sp.]|nr:hypothetical protein [Porphyrobacter sp.]